MRRLATILLAFLLVAYSGLAVGLYRSRVAPGSAGPSWRLTEATAADLESAAEERIRSGLERLHDPSADPAEAFRGFREALAQAEGLLERSLRAQPTRARALARLAAVRWEIDPPADEAAFNRQMVTIRLAAAAAPASPGVHLVLGDLQLRMGLHEAARGAYARTVELDPGLAVELVERAAGILPSTRRLLGVLPRHPEVLAALEPHFRREGRQAEFLDLAERALAGEPAASLLAGYGRAGLEAGQAERVLARLETLDTSARREADAERLRQISRACLALDRLGPAIEAARAARVRLPGAPDVTENEGDVLLAAGRTTAAREAFREALHDVAQRFDDRRWRARLYRKIGQAEELSGRSERAVQPYRLALRLDPTEPHASRRLSEMGKAAGLAAPD